MSSTFCPCKTPHRCLFNAAEGKMLCWQLWIKAYVVKPTALVLSVPPLIFLRDSSSTWPAGSPYLLLLMALVGGSVKPTRDWRGSPRLPAATALRAAAGNCQELGGVLVLLLAKAVSSTTHPGACSVQARDNITLVYVWLYRDDYLCSHEN